MSVGLLHHRLRVCCPITSPVFRLATTRLNTVVWGVGLGLGASAEACAGDVAAGLEALGESAQSATAIPNPRRQDSDVCTKAPREDRPGIRGCVHPRVSDLKVI